jgi:cuticle protein
LTCSVIEPNGALRTVEYTADDRGFNPIVTYSYGHQGSNAAVYSSLGPNKIPGVYAPAFVSDKRVQIVDKFTGPPPAINIQPFAIPVPSFAVQAPVQVHHTHAPIVVPAPVRQAFAPELIAQAHEVNYAPAYMPPVTAFYQPQPQVQVHHHVEPVRTYLPPPPQVTNESLWNGKDVYFRDKIK